MQNVKVAPNKRSQSLKNRHYSSSGDNLDNANDNKKIVEFQKDEVILSASKSLLRISWLSWWTQMILSTVSSVTLLFTKSVMSGGSSSKGSGGLFLAGSGIVMSFLSIIWTWGAGARLSKKLLRRGSIKRIAAANMIRKTLTIGALLNVIGMFITIIGAEQIVGGLAAKVLTSSTNIFSAQQSILPTQLLQPIDILVVQANTNTLLSHFCSLFLLLSLVKWVDRLDPPSTNEKKRTVAFAQK